MARLDTERQEKLEPKRTEYALKRLSELGIEPIHSCEQMIKFMFKGHIVTFYPYSGWHTGKSIKDGRGVRKLLKQLK